MPPSDVPFFFFNVMCTHIRVYLIWNPSVENHPEVIDFFFLKAILRSHNLYRNLKNLKLPFVPSNLCNSLSGLDNNKLHVTHALTHVSFEG